MKNKTLTLTKILIKNGEGFGIKEGKGKSSILMLILLGIGIFPAIFALVKFVSSAYDVLYTIGQEGVIISWGIAIISIMIFVLGIIYIISSFYLSTDIDNLLHIPLRPKQIVGAKFLVVTVYEYLITSFIYLPVLIVFGIKSAAGIFFYLCGLVIFLLIPVLPLAAASIIVMLIMRFTNVSKNKDAFKLAGGVLALVLALGVNVFFQRIAMNMSLEDIEQLLMAGENSLVAVTSGVFPTVRFAATAMLNIESLTGLLNLALFIIISVAVYMLLIYLGEILYFKGVVGISESGSRRNSGRVQNMDKSFVKSSAIKTYTISEINLLIRTPIYFLNCVLMNFIWPVFLIIPIMAGSMDLGMIAELGEMIKGPEMTSKVVVAAVGILTFVAGTNGITATSISREGQALFVKKYLPISYKDQITGKVLSGFLMGLLGMLVMLVLATVVLKLPLSIALMILVIGWMPILLLSYTGIFIDLYNPKLQWDTEQKAVKQNLNVLFNLVICILLVGGTVFTVFKFNLGLIPVILLLISFFGGLNAIMYYMLYTKGVKQFSRLEG